MAEKTGNDPAVASREPWTSRNFVRKCFQNSPWLTISVLLHVLIITVLAIARPGHDAVPTVSEFSFASPPIEKPQQVEAPVQPIDRTVPVMPDQIPGLVNPNPEYTPDVAPGLRDVTDEDDITKDPGLLNPNPEASPDLPSGATGGNAIGAGIRPGHPGITSSYAGRKLGGDGPGDGGTGQKGDNGRGGTPETHESVLSALRWLRNHQSPDGRWDCAEFSAQCKDGICEGAGSSAHDVGVTGLALLCFLGAGYTHEEGVFKETVRNAVRYLRSQQDEDGCFGPRVGQHFMYDHACAALAMAEAYGMTESLQLRKPAQQGITFILRAQNPYSAWRYAFPPDGDNDTSVTGWMIMALKSAKLSGLTIDDEAFKSAMNFITEMTDDATGRTGYTERGSAPSRLNEMTQLFPAERSEALTAVGMLVRIFSAKDGASDPMVLKGADLLVNKLPNWDTKSGEIDFYYWYYATLSMFQVGGPHWDKWNAALKTACLDHQRNKEKECAYGSWDPIDPWSGAGGRVYSTALNCLSMEVYSRYERVFSMPRKGPKKK